MDSVEVDEWLSQLHCLPQANVVVVIRIRASVAVKEDGAVLREPVVVRTGTIRLRRCRRDRERELHRRRLEDPLDPLQANELPPKGKPLAEDPGRQHVPVDADLGGQEIKGSEPGGLVELRTGHVRSVRRPTRCPHYRPCHVERIPALAPGALPVRAPARRPEYNPIPAVPLFPFIAVTDQNWFAFLLARASNEGGKIDEVNFWQPRAQRPMARLEPGTPVFFKLKAPNNAIAGYGFYASFTLLRLELAWDCFGQGNGAPTFERFLHRIGDYRDIDLLADRHAPCDPIGCTVLRDAMFWPRERWISWSRSEGWAPNIVQGKTERDEARASRLLAEISYDHLDTPEEFLSETFEPLDADEREILLAKSRPRVGQGTFRSRLLDAYGRRCAITGEHTEIVLDAAHIQPYLGPRSNHIQNGLLLTKEFHTLFDSGYVTITPDYRVRVSPQLKDEWDNGVRYYPYDGQRLLVQPETVRDRPGREVLEWHGERVYRG